MAAASSPNVLKWLYNHNPFYVISAVLMLYAVRQGYGEMEIGAINCWVMMGILAGYTFGLAAVGILIVRWGRVWEDARSILLLILLLFLAVSISADDLFVKMESSMAGTLLMVSGFLFSATLMEFTLKGVGLRMGRLYRLPLHAFIALFFFAPWWCSPELHPRTVEQLEWMIFGFPVIGGALLLSLLPAVRRGPTYVADNGSPWRWPLYPWTAFGMITIALALRSFALSMTFGPSGPIWIQLSGGRRMIAFDIMWNPFFLIPIAFAVLILIIEAGLTTRNTTLVRRALKSVPILLLLSFPYSHGRVAFGFYDQFTSTLGSPIWLAVWLQLGIYLVNYLRGVKLAETGVFASIVLLTFIGPETMGLRSLTSPQLLPLSTLGVILFVFGLRRRNSLATFSGAALFISLLYPLLSQTPVAGWKATICFHVLWTTTVICGFAFKDEFAHKLRIVGAGLMPIAALAVLFGPQTSHIPLMARFFYIMILTGLSILLAQTFRSQFYFYAFCSLLAVLCYEGSAIGFRAAAQVVGTTTLTSILWSGGTMLIGILISFHKAHWLPQRLIPQWQNGAAVQEEHQQ